MSPKTKKMLMIAAAAVGGYIVYTKVIKKPAAPAQIKSVSMTDAAKAAAIKLAQTQIAKLSGVQESLGVEEALGVTQSLGSLGGSCFR
jgi:hypothetical protein